MKYVVELSSITSSEDIGIFSFTIHLVHAPLLYEANERMSNEPSVGRDCTEFLTNCRLVTSSGKVGGMNQMPI